MSEQPNIPVTEESKSSAITGHGYDAASRTLLLRFNGGRSYRYADVPPEVYAALKEAKSMGGYFGKHINGKFKAI